MGYAVLSFVKNLKLKNDQFCKWNSYYKHLKEN